MERENQKTMDYSLGYLCPQTAAFQFLILELAQAFSVGDKLWILAFTGLSLLHHKSRAGGKLCYG